MGRLGKGMALGLGSMGGAFIGHGKHWKDIYDYQMHKDDAEPGQGLIGVQPMTKQQKRDKKARDAKKAKTPMNQQTYS